jgi:hypothetical protein
MSLNKQIKKYNMLYMVSRDCGTCRVERAVMTVLPECLTYRIYVSRNNSWVSGSRALCAFQDVAGLRDISTFEYKRENR